jgi:poly-gamma-glutamate synthesis protein (capsule biosynthesis protein)
VAVIAVFVLTAAAVALVVWMGARGGTPSGTGTDSAPAATSTANASTGTPDTTPSPAATVSAEPTPSLEPTAPVSDTITFAAVGDILFGTGPNQLIASKGGAAPLAKVAKLLRAADVTIANLETPLSGRGASVAGKPAHLIFNGDPRGIQSLSSAGIDIVSIANNHAMDHGTVALKDTLANLDKAGIAHAGAGLNTKDAWKPAIITVKGRRIAYVAATQIVPAYFTPSSTRAGVAVGTSISRVTAAVRSARKNADIVIVAMHWGVEQSLTANARQKHDARALIDAGADIVLSHHPHVIQGIEFYKGKLVAYSLGNFLFPYKTIEGRKSFILKFDWGPKGVSDITAVPVYLGSYGVPTVQKGSSARSILGKLAAISKPLGTTITVKNDVGYIKP